MQHGLFLQLWYIKFTQYLNICYLTLSVLCAHLFNKIGLWLHCSSWTIRPRTFIYGSFFRSWDGISWKIFIMVKFINHCHGNQNNISSFTVIRAITLSLSIYTLYPSVHLLAKNGRNLPWHIEGLIFWSYYSFNQNSCSSIDLVVSRDLITRRWLLGNQDVTSLWYQRVPTSRHFRGW